MDQRNSIVVSRRKFLTGMSAACMLSSRPLGAKESAPLKSFATERGILYGCAIRSKNLSDVPFTDAVIRDAAIIVPESEMKWSTVQPEAGRFDFSFADQLAAFSAQNKMKMRGHTLVWHAANPNWLLEALKNAPRERILTDHIEKLVGHYRGRIHSWDVVNEAIEPSDGRADGLRVKSPWYQAFGTNYIDLAFHAARKADPDALLCYNDFGVEAAASWHAPRRKAVLQFCEKLLSKGVPLDVVGIQGHLKAYRETFDEDVFSRFLFDIRSLGLKIMVTEHDVADIGGPFNIFKRDADVARLTRRFLDVVLDCPATIGVLTWGLSDRYSWLSDPVWGKRYCWPDGQLSRGLPLDASLLRKPMWYAMADAFVSR